jgi:hypothetical protein
MVAVAYALDDLLRSREWSSLGVAYLIGVGVVGVLVFPLGSAFAMPDWYINAAKALPPWNYYFQFPNPPQGDRGQLISVNAVKLVLGIAAAVAAGAFALYGRRWIDPPSGGAIATSEGGDQEGNAGDDKEDRPEAVPGDLRNVGPHQEPDA